LTGNDWKQRLISLAAMAVLAAWLACGRRGAAEPEGGLPDWKYEVLRLKNGSIYHGLVKEETGSRIRFWEVKRPTGKPALRQWHVWERDKVARIDRLDAKERAILWQRIQLLDPKLKEDENHRAETLDLEPAPWGKNTSGGLSYTTPHFVLISNAERGIVAKAAIRLEQIFAAYGSFLPPHSSTETEPITIFLADSVAEYLSLARGRGLTIHNPAYYDRKRNEIVCGSDFHLLGKTLADLHKQDEQLDQQLVMLKKRYKGKIPDLLRYQIKRDREEISRVRKKINKEDFDKASRRLFQTLFHEAFHAYLDNFVYRAEKEAVPCWLNEGLGQIFETAFIDAGLLRVGHVDKVRLLRVQALLRTDDLVPLARLLPATPKQFLVRHASDQQLSDSYYLSSWALAFYLLADRKVLGDPKKLDLYVSSLKRGMNPLAAFRILVDRPLPDFQKDFRDYLLRLQPNGSLAKMPN
jgi:hypothetical protein